MELTQYEGGNRKYLNIIQGSFRQKVDPETDGAVRREYETSTGQKGVKHELVFKSVSGNVTSLIIVDTDFGEQLQLELDGEGVVSVGVSTRYFQDLAKKLVGADLTKSLTLTPFDFTTDDEKRMVGVTIEQDDKKLKNIYWDEKAKAPVKEFPKPEGDTSKYNSRKWKAFYATVDEFLIEALKKKAQEIPEPKEEPASEIPQSDDSDVDLSKVPF